MKFQGNDILLSYWTIYLAKSSLLSQVHEENSLGFFTLQAVVRILEDWKGFWNHRGYNQYFYLKLFWLSNAASRMDICHVDGCVTLIWPNPAAYSHPKRLPDGFLHQNSPLEELGTFDTKCSFHEDSHGAVSLNIV